MVVKEDEEFRRVDFSKVPKLKSVFQKENGEDLWASLCHPLIPSVPSLQWPSLPPPHVCVIDSAPF